LLAETNLDTVTACNLAKGDDIEVFTIAFDVKDVYTKGLLQNCASAPDMFFDAANATSLRKAFEDIAETVQENDEVVRLKR